MASSSAAEGLIRFMDAVPDQAQGVSPIERLVSALRGQDGAVDYGLALKLSGLSPGDFIEAVSRGLATGVFDRSTVGDAEQLRLTKTADMLFSPNT
jgi:hypothetical protein